MFRLETKMCPLLSKSPQSQRQGCGACRRQTSQILRGCKCGQTDVFCPCWIRYYAAQGWICLLIVSSFVHCHGCKENIFKSWGIKFNSSRETFSLTIMRTFVRVVSWHPVRTPPHKSQTVLEADCHTLDNTITTSYRLFLSPKKKNSGFRGTLQKR